MGIGSGYRLGSEGKRDRKEAATFPDFKTFIYSYRPRTLGF